MILLQSLLEIISVQEHVCNKPAWLNQWTAQAVVLPNGSIIVIIITICCHLQRKLF